ncbi:dihydroxyacetone kinase subunit DhaL [Kaistia defluvii]|uniref:dihydroxyacetone kinase subunit DhaL n=1 Tax=Kaistia defluvii TaxID=410841 RepID=UPI002250C03B|nr:dihydroxyacetone kinase subunit DhaL [Kaistia defluvii]MCX5517864.1 dihydroxyacetone kinase subunit DhaL [Kaistia defluvii]
MKKLINEIPVVVRQALEGLVALHPQLALLEGETTVVRADIEAFRQSGKVAIVTGGGAGHEPAHAGYVGRGMLTAAVSGDVFASPSTDAVYAAVKAVAGPAGVLVIVKNYTGDRLNFGLAAEMARADGIPVEVVVVDDDAALGSAEHTAGRRGIAGTVLVHKIAGAAADAGLPLDAVAAAARRAIASVASMGVALSACTVPAAGKANFTLADNEMELGLGIHGEPGVRRAEMAPARAIVVQLLDTLIADRGIMPGQPVALLVNNLGATPVMEQTIIAGEALSELASRGIPVERAYCGTFLTAIDMAGISLSLLAADPETLAALDAGTEAPAWPSQGGAIAPAPRRIAVAANAQSDHAGTGPAMPDRVLNLLKAACEALIAAEPELTEMDRLVGDGDIGHSLAGGASALLAELDAWRGKPVDAVLQAVGRTLRRSVGGTSGPLYAAFAIAAGQQVTKGAADAGAFQRGFAAGTEAITRLGGASAGDRTMVDALLPAAASLAQHPRDLQAAARAARAGAEATSAMAPRRGRSSYLGARAMGHPDPGAVAVAMLLEAIAAGRS